MKFILLLVLAGCSDTKTFVGNCYAPFIFGGNIVKVVECKTTFSLTNSSYCLIKVKSIAGNYYSDTVQLSRLEDSIKVSCEEFDK